MKLHKRITATMLLLAIIITIFPSASAHEHTAEAASSCPYNGDMKIIAYLGCRACSGTGIEYKEEGAREGADTLNIGSGVSSYTTPYEDSEGNVWTTYYRCYNCGVCPKDSIIAYKVLEKKNSDIPYNVGERDGNNQGPGKVPKRWCTYCGPILLGNGEAYVKSEASYSVYHIAEEVTKTYTVSVVASPANGGTAGDGGTFEEGTTIDLWYAANEGWTFAGWSGGTVTNDRHTVTKNVTLTARFVKLTEAPKPTTAPVEIVLPQASPTPIPTKIPRPFEIADPIIPPASADPPVINPVANVHEDRCYTGYLHTCTQRNCYRANYSHTASCWGIVSSTTCPDCKGQNNAGFYSTCTACSGSGKAEVSCPSCGGDGKITCSTCNGTGSYKTDCTKCGGDGDCTTCGGDGKVSGSCGGTIKDTISHGFNGTDSNFTCSHCNGTGGTMYPGDCGYCGGSGKGTKTYCLCGGYTISGAYGSDKACTHAYKCGSCGASGYSAGTCTKTVANKKTCGTCSGSGNCTSCSGSGATSKTCSKTESCTGCGGDGALVGQCGTCTGTGQTWAACITCSGSGEEPVYGYLCGDPGGCYISSYTKVCGKENGSYYLNGTKCSPLCHKVVVSLDPLYPKQTLQIGETPNVSAYATFISTEGMHGDFPHQTVSCTMTGFDATRYNTWQTVTLSYGTYSDTAKNAKAKTTTIQVYVAGDVTVTFDAGGGTCSTKSKTVTYGQTYGTLPVATRENYAFYGWILKTTNANGIPVEREVTKDSIVATPTNHTLTAAWISLEQTVHFDPNGGVCDTKSKTVIYGKPYGILPTPTRAGYTFSGWWYGDVIKDAKSLVEGYDNHTLVAGWIPNTYTITFDAGDGTCNTKTMQVQTDSTANNVAAPIPTYAGYTFTGWYTAERDESTGEERGEKVFDATGKWCPGTYWKNGKWSYTGNLTVYAQWTPNTYTVTLHGMGATTLPQTSVEIVYEKLGPKVLKPTRVGYTFDGFYMKPKGSGVKIYNSMGYGMNPWTTPSDGIVYASWIPITYTVEVAKEEIRVTPVTITKSSTVSYDETYTIPSPLEDRAFTVSYDLRKELTGSSTPTVSLTAANTEAELVFSGWQLFQKNGTDYQYLKRYTAGAKVQGLSSEQDAVLTLFPYWSGSSATVILPLPMCKGYRFVGWGDGRNITEEGELFHIEEGEDTTYKPVSEEDVLYAYWEPKTYEVTLVTDTAGVEEGDILQRQTSVIMTFDEVLPKVEPPQSETYIFLGYYDKLDENGAPAAGAKKYYDEKGESTRVWGTADEDVSVLYAYFVSGKLYGFTVYEIEGGAAWEEAKGMHLQYTVSTQSEDVEEKYTLPLRSGGHPFYQNKGGLPAGGSFSFLLKSNGCFGGKDASLTIFPHLLIVTEEGYEEAEVYYEETTPEGVFLRQWCQNEKKMQLWAEVEENEIETVMEWCGTFSLPERLYVAKEGSDVITYQRENGLTFFEDFWLLGQTMMLVFEMKVENEQGDVLYYGKVPETIKNNIWCMEAGTKVRSDNKGVQYEIQGGEVAVIYPGEAVAEDYVIHGIY